MEKMQSNTSGSLTQKQVETVQPKIQESKVDQAQSTKIEEQKPKMSMEEKLSILNQLKSRDLSDATRNALIKMLEE